MVKARIRCGLTLLEMIMAIFLFAIMVPLLLSSWPIHKEAVNLSRGSLCASHICRQVLEDALTTGYDGVDSLATRPLPDRTVELKTETIISGQSTVTSREFVWVVNVESKATNSALLDGEKLVQVSVNWEENGEAKKIEVSTLVAEEP